MLVIPIIMVEVTWLYGSCRRYVGRSSEVSEEVCRDMMKVVAVETIPANDEFFEWDDEID